MKILRVHNFYGSAAPSGENTIFQIENDLLIKENIQTFNYTVSSDNFEVQSLSQKFRTGINVVWSSHSKAIFDQILVEQRPDVIHVHNTFPFISPSIFWAKKNKIPIVMTVHNFRLVCPKAIPLLNGKQCTACINQRSTLPALMNRCYRNSFWATLPLALKVQLHRSVKTWDKIDAFIFLTDFQKKIFWSSGIGEKYSVVKPNPNPSLFSDEQGVGERNGVCFIGRLSEEKGVSDLISAWDKLGIEAPKLTIVGDGPMSAELKKQASNNKQIAFTGNVSPDETRVILRKSRLCVIPSNWFEGFPVVLSDAITTQTPTVVSEIGSLHEIAREVGLPTFKPSDPVSLSLIVKSYYDDRESLCKIMERMKKYYFAYLAPQTNTRQLIKIYESVLKID